MTSTERIQVTYTSGRCVLVIADVTVDDEAEYKCEARNEVGVASTWMQLVVESKRHVAARVPELKSRVPELESRVPKLESRVPDLESRALFACTQQLHVRMACKHYMLLSFASHFHLPYMHLSSQI